MLEDRKTCTARTKRYGKPGDTFRAFNETFVLMDVALKYLGDVADLWSNEGLSSKDEFIEVWNHLHPNRGYDTDDEVWLHVFQRHPQVPHPTIQG